MLFYSWLCIRCNGDKERFRRRQHSDLHDPVYVCGRRSQLNDPSSMSCLLIVCAIADMRAAVEYHSWQYSHSQLIHSFRPRAHVIKDVTCSYICSIQPGGHQDTTSAQLAQLGLDLIIWSAELLPCRGLFWLETSLTKWLMRLGTRLLHAGTGWVSARCWPVKHT